MTPSVNFPASLRAESISAFCAGEFAEPRDLLNFIGRHAETDPPLDHVEHGLRGARQVVDVLRREPEPGPHFLHIFVIFTTYGASSGSS